MKLAISTLLLAAILSGCSWDPIRDNPVDPSSPYYEPPPPRNRPPAIDTLFIITDCLDNPYEYMCGFTATCRVLDPDANVLKDSVLLWIGADLMGPMTYEPGAGEWILSLQQHQIPGGNLSVFVGRSVRVIAWDDSLTADTTYSVFPPLFRDWPEVSYPKGDILVPAVLETLHPRLGWEDLSGPGSHSWTVTVRLLGEVLAWDTSGMDSPADSVVVVSRELLNARDHSGTVYYTWSLTVVDSFGNRATAPANYFICSPPSDTLSDPDPGRDRPIWD